MKMPGEVEVEAWDPMTEAITAREGKPYKPRMGAQPPKPREGETADQMFQRFIAEDNTRSSVIPNELSPRAPAGIAKVAPFAGESPPENLTLSRGAQRFTADVSLGERFKQHWLNTMYGGTAGIAEATLLQEEMADPELQQRLLAERAWREREFQNMPEAETPLEYGAAIAGGILGGFTDPLAMVPIFRFGSLAWRAKNPIISSLLNQSVSGAAMNAGANSSLQALEMGADLREEFDPYELGTQTGIGAVAGSGFGLGEGYIAKKAMERAALNRGLERAPEPGKATPAPRRGPIETELADVFVPEGGGLGEADIQEAMDFGNFLVSRGIESEERFGQLDEGQQRQLYNEYLAQASELAEEAVSQPRPPEGLMEQYGPERLNAAQTALFGEVVGTRNLTPEQNLQLQDYLAGRQPSVERGAEIADEFIPEEAGGGLGPDISEEAGLGAAEIPQQVTPGVPIGPYRRFRPEELKVDAKRFQFKEGANEAGVTDRLKGVKRWDPTKAGQTLVWESKEGEFFIADGHQRHALALRMAAEGQDVQIPAYIIREVDGITQEKARAIAAAKNIAEGTGSAIDAAKILRDRPDMAVDLPPTSALVRDAEGLAKLSDNAFGMVINKKVPANYAAIVGKLALDKDTHADLLAMLAKEDPDNVIEAESMVRDALEAPAVQSTMEDMFGTAQVTQILFKERAQILSAAAKTIRKDRAAFQTLVREEERISGAGNVLKSDVNLERAQQDAALLATIQATARRKGPVAEALATGAQRLKDGESKSAVVRDFIEALRAESQAIGQGRGRAGGAGPAEQVAASTVRRNTDSAAFRNWFSGSKVTDAAGQPRPMVHATDVETDFEAFRAPSYDIGMHFGTAGQANDRLAFKRAQFPTLLGPARSIPVYLSIKNPLRMHKDVGDWNGFNVGSALKKMPEFAGDVDEIDRIMNARGATAAIRDFLQRKGYDGVVYKNKGEIAGGEALRARENKAREAFAMARGKPNSFLMFTEITPEDRASPEYKAFKQAEAVYNAVRDARAEDSFIAFEPTQIKSVLNRGTFDPQDPRIAFRAGARNTESKPFKSWFRKSAAVDEDGEPLPVYHGTFSEDFESFDPRMRGRISQSASGASAFWFAGKPQTAEGYADPTGGSAPPNILRLIKNLLGLEDERAGRIMPVYLSIQNPFKIDMRGTSYDEFTFQTIVEKAKKLGKDGVILKNVFDPAGEWGDILDTVYAVFEPTQIKSVFNRGTWDRQDPRISFSPRRPSARQDDLLAWQSPEAKVEAQEIAEEAERLRTMPPGPERDARSRAWRIKLTGRDEPLPLEMQRAGFRAMVEKNRAENAATQERIENAIAAEGAFAISALDGRSVIVTPSLRKPDLYQITYFDRTGEATGHMETRREDLAKDTMSAIGRRALVEGPRKRTITTGNINEYRGKVDSTELAALKANYRKAFKEEGAIYVPLSSLISHKNELADPKMVTGEKIDPRQRATDFMVKTIKGEGAPRDPLDVRANGDGTYTILDGNATAQAAMLAGWERVPVKVRGAAEPGADGKPQLVLPGAERITDRQLAARRGQGKMQPKRPQRTMDFGLFGADRDQLDLVDLAKSRIAPMARDDAEHIDFTPSGTSRSIKIGDSTIIYAPRGDEVEIVAVRTPPHLRGQGRAREAMTAFLNRVDDEGLTVKAASTPLDQATDPAGLLNFYQSLGFKAGRKINSRGDVEVIREGPPPEVAELREMVGGGWLIPVADYTSRRTAKEVANAFVATQPKRPLADLYETGRAERWKAELDALGTEIAARTGARYGPTPLKDRAKAQEKMARKGYTSTAQLTDIVRGGFLVEKPEQAEQIVLELARRWRTLDEGWSFYANGYFDRKVLVQFPDQTIGEIQLWEPNLLSAKQGPNGHALYEKSRSLPDGDPQRLQLDALQKQAYDAAFDAIDASWASVLGRSGRVPNIFENKNRMSSSSSRGLPESATSAELTGVQPPPGSRTAQAQAPSMTAGRFSQSINIMPEGIAARTRPPQQQPVPTNRAQSGVAGEGRAERLEDISADLKRLVGFKVPVRQGRLAKYRNAQGQTQQVGGQYDRGQGVIRMAEMSDFETQTHETAHALETEYGRDLATLQAANAAELDQMAYPGAVNVTSEGFAEFMRFYVSNPGYAQRNAPAFYQAFEEFLGRRNPKQLLALRGLQDRYVRWQYTPSRAAIAADIVSTRRRGAMSDSISEMRRNGIGVTLGRYFDNVYTRTIDKAHPLNRMVDEMAKVYERNFGQALDLKAANNPYVLARLFPDAQSRGHMDIMHGVLRHNSTVRDPGGLADALEVALGRQWQNWGDEQITEFAAYLVSRRAIQEYQRFFGGELPNVPGKFTLGDYQVAKDEFEAAHPEWIMAAEMVYDWQRNMLAKKRDAGFIDDATFNELTQRVDYVPFLRDLTDLDKEVLNDMPMGRTLKHSLLKRFRGSKRSIINPIEMMAKDAYDVNQLIAANEIAKAIDDLARTVGPGAGAFVERIKDKDLKGTEVGVREVLRSAAKEQGLSPQDIDQLTATVGNLLGDDARTSIFRMVDTNEKGEPIIYVWRDGKRSALRLADGEFGKEVYQALTGLNREMQGMWTAIASLPSTALRYGITTHPPYMLANFIRDQVSAWVLTGDGFIPFISGAAGLRDELTQREITQIYNSFGGIMGGGNVAALDRARVRREINALQKRGYAIKRFASWRGLAELTELTETGTRLGLFKNAFSRARREGLNDYEAAVEAAYTSRDYIDFGRHGSKMLAARRLVPFLNSALQGLDKTVRVAITPWVKLRTGRPLSAADKRNLKTSAKAWMKMTTIGLAGLGLSYLYKDDPEYEEISDYLKATHWMVKMGDGKWAAIPKPFEMGFVSNLFERGFEALYKQDPTAWDRFLSGLWQNTAPPFVGGVLGGDAGSALGDIPIVGTAASIAANRDLATGRDLVPQHLQGLEPYLQYNAYSSDLAKKIGEAINVSPIVIDQALSGFGGSWGRSIGQASTDIANEEGLATSTANMMSRRFVREVARGATSTRAFWDMIGATTGTMARVSNTYKSLLDSAGQAEAAAYVDRMSEDEKAYALLNAHFEAEAKRLHPMRRAQDAIGVISKVRKEIAGNDFAVQADDDLPLEERETITLTPSQRQTAQDIMAKIEMVEARNALVTLEAPGWAQREPMDLASLYRDLELALPQVSEELTARFEKAKIYDAESVKESWPDVKERILTDRQDAYFDDLVFGAR